ncbi:hypothetical protein B7435_26820 [Mycolicibacterium peregrinum]|uniref:hypothetical protein n=1 Tax=Mycolicibacterium peregrinum TaxID=43304 RepID=UPI000B73FAB9|nr:hypothetical protein [Mycolicibacterium peregrinum]OWL97004.1 hypothetical protein B7435_26820 [Mycolicibacterium peregrinum]
MITEFKCETWCEDGDGHPHYLLRGDQSCWGPQHQVVLSLERGAPGTGVEAAYQGDVPAISAYAYRGWYELPKVKLNIYYRRALWDDQNVHVEIWAEKDAIQSVVYPVTREFDVPLMVARGFSSESFLHETAQAIIADQKPAVIYQLGDHDPSGVAAWEHTRRRLAEFAPDVEFHFQRIAVTPDQIAEYQLPTRPTKQSDSRAANFKGDSVEVDALPSTALRTLVRSAIEQWLDPEVLRLTRIAEQSERDVLRRIAGDWAAG